MGLRVKEGAKMIGVICSILSGIAMSVQGVMNTRLGEKIGLYESNAYVQGTAFILSVAAMLFVGDGRLGDIFKVEKIFLFGGVLGLIITITVMLGIKSLSPTVAISIILVSQLLSAALIDAFGWLATEKVPFGVWKYLGLGLMIGGVILFKYRG
jgi:transporter family-2 protein